MNTKILSLDVSTKTGFSVFENDKLLTFGQLRVEVEDFNVNDFPEKSPKYPFNIVRAANEMASLIASKYSEFKPDVVVIENTVKGRNRHTQRILEFIHKALLDQLGQLKVQPVYMDPSQWRKVLDMRLSKDDKKNNRDVSKGKKRGRITKKHLSVRLVNDMFQLKLKLKDNDIADSIALGRAYFETIRGS